MIYQEVVYCLTWSDAAAAARIASVIALAGTGTGIAMTSRVKPRLSPPVLAAWTLADDDEDDDDEDGGSWTFSKVYDSSRGPDNVIM